MKKIQSITMKAAVLFKSKTELKIVDVSLPTFLLDGQVLVKIHYSGICGSQLGEIDAIKGKDNYLPHLLGHEGSGTVIEIGPKVKNIKKNDTVILHWRPGRGLQAKPPIYEYKNKKINAGWVTTFNEFAIVSENRLTKVRDNIDLSLAPLFGCAVTTGFGVIRNNAKLKKNENIVIFGAGGIGLNMIHAAKIEKANKIIAVDVHKNKLDLAKKCGATHVINSSKKTSTYLKLKKILDKDDLDIFIDNTGNTKIIEQGYEILSKKGRLILVGVPKIGSKVKIFTLPLHFGKQIIGSEGGSSKPDKDIISLIELTKKKKIDLKSIVSKVYSLNEINTAISDIRTGRIAGRAIIKL